MISVGSTVYIKKRIGRKNGKTFTIAMKVKQSAGDLIYAGGTLYKTDEVLQAGQDQSKEYEEYKLNAKLTNELKGRVSALEIKQLSNKELEKILTILKGEK